MESSPEPCTLFSSTPVQYLTVWRKSLLFNGHGYTVYDDADGSIVFRVEDYAHDWRRHALLMDRHGNVLLTVRRCRCNVRYRIAYCFSLIILLLRPCMHDIELICN
ncbi:hypothetical protein ZIOFF_056288 [Zingiber officinale]|uniref:Uncharacterized protein n=1 Tax=Zingiber officinale TaxID=94328 RepID=A0A8J5FNH6_ZINOF|nr:hypothetical protein ZIOFF_056288 [Zingiber officinale]